MKITRRTEITYETHETTVIEAQRNLRRFPGRSAAIRFETSVNEIYRRIRNGEFRCIEAGDGSLLLRLPLQ